jgi:hypothetical protein
MEDELRAQAVELMHAEIIVHAFPPAALAETLMRTLEDADLTVVDSRLLKEHGEMAEGLEKLLNFAANYWHSSHAFGGNPSDEPEPISNARALLQSLSRSE